jgi:four helix bundle protein
MRINKFEDLEIWKLSVKLAVNIYKLTTGNLFSKDYGLRDQIRRSAVSVSSNIAEGFEMLNNNDLVRFLRIAKGSAGEARSQLCLALELKYVKDSDCTELREELEILSAKIGKFISYLVSKRKDNEFVLR